MTAKRSWTGLAPQLLALASVAASGWLILTLNYSGSRSAGWRHELICSGLAAFAVYAATWVEGRPWPQPGAVYAGAGLVAPLVAMLAPVPTVAALAVLAVSLGAGGLVAVRLELEQAGGGPLLARLAILGGIAEVAAIAPTFLFLVLRGDLA